MKQGLLVVVLKGTGALMMHSPVGMQRIAPGGMGRKVIPTPEQEAAAGRYLLPDGNFYVPAEAVRNCMLSGARGYRIEKRPAMMVLSGVVRLIDERFPLLDGDGKPYPGDRYRVDTRRVVVQKQGILRSRAEVPLPWMLRCYFGVNIEVLPDPRPVQDALSVGGWMVGLLDHRPEKKGWHGTFEVVEIRIEPELPQATTKTKTR